MRAQRYRAVANRKGISLPYFKVFGYFRVMAGTTVRREQLYDILLPLLFCGVVAASGLLALRMNTGSWWPANASLTNWDPGWYKSIAEHGYVFDPNAANNTAFFPFFPYFWKMLGVGSTGICLVNGSLFTIGCYLLFRNFPSGRRTKMLYLGLSLVVFCITPFSESLFFLCASVLLTGLERRNNLLIIPALIGTALCRSVSTIFFPAFLLMLLIRTIEEKKVRPALKYLSYGLISLAGLFTVFFIHWFQTGEFFAFQKTQKFWYAHFQLPDIPFSTWKPEDNGYADQFAVLLCFLSIIFLIRSFVDLLRSDKKLEGEARLFSFLYLAGVMMLMLFTHGGGFNSMNRYVLATPFLYFFVKEIGSWKFSKSTILGLVAFGIIYYVVGWHMATSGARIAVFLSSLTGMTILTAVVRSQKPYAYMLLLLFCLASAWIQGILWFRFVTNIWVG